jgi:DNA-binding NarL/FixJ family response regulator
LTEEEKRDAVPSGTPVNSAGAPKRALIFSESRLSSLAVRSALSDAFALVEEVTPDLFEAEVSPLDFSVIVIVECATIEIVSGLLERLEGNAGELSRVVVVLRDDHEPSMLQEFLWKVAAVVPASVPIGRIAKIANAVHDGFSILPSSLVRSLVEASPDFRPDRQQRPELTNQELRILDLLATGQSNKRIADTLGVSDGTVRVHIRSIVNKLGATNRTHAALLAAGIGVAGGIPDRATPGAAGRRAE